MAKTTEKPVQNDTPSPLSHAEDPILTISEASRLIGKHPSTIQRWVEDGLLEYVWMPSELRGIRKSQIDKFLSGTALKPQTS